MPQAADQVEAGTLVTSDFDKKCLLFNGQGHAHAYVYYIKSAC